MDPLDLLKRLVETLDRLQLRYAVGGSMASMMYAEPRFTNDVDIVVDLPIERVNEFLAAFSPDEFYVSADAARSAILHRQQFNIIHPDSGLKVDIIIPKSRPLDQFQLDRVRRIRPREDFEAAFASPEDLIIRKLEAYAEGESEKHLRDIASMLVIQKGRIDTAMIARWADELGVAEVWRLVQSRLP